MSNRTKNVPRLNRKTSLKVRLSKDERFACQDSGTTATLSSDSSHDQPPASDWRKSDPLVKLLDDYEAESSSVEDSSFHTSSARSSSRHSDDSTSRTRDHNVHESDYSSAKSTYEEIGTESSSVGGVFPSIVSPRKEGLDLNMIKTLRAELEKVGEVIVNRKEGEQFLKRAQILASINSLATNIPRCVVDHLGEEIRNALDDDDSVNIFGDFQHDGEELDLSEDSIDDSDEVEAKLFAQSISDMSLLPSDREVVLRKRSIRHINLSDDNLSAESSNKSGLSYRKISNASYHSQERVLKRGLSSDLSYQGTSASVMSDDDLLEQLPAVAQYEGALMFVDISGFTKLSTVLDPEGLSKVINSYFQLIVHQVHKFHGDIQKFAGDALFAEWRVTAEMSRDECVCEAAACAAALIQKCADFPLLALVSARDVLDSTVKTLNVHCGLGVGKMTGLHIGDSHTRREYLYVGSAVDQATDACANALLGEAMASKEFYDILCQNAEQPPDAKRGVRLVANKDKEMFDLFTFMHSTRQCQSRGITELVDGLDLDALMKYRRLMSLYVHPVVVANSIIDADTLGSCSKPTKCAKEKNREDAELRSVYVAFLNLMFPKQLTGDVEEDGEVIHLLNDTMNLVSKKLKHYSGHLRQFIFDDKGFVVIITFGLRGSTFPNLVAERALPATLLIQKALDLELGVKSKIGATFGDVYCGAVGGDKRHEYAVMGPSVNLAARLMYAKNNPGILVDKTVRHLAASSYDFKALSPIKAKGYSEMVPIFEPVAIMEREWGITIEPNFVGRADEVSELVALAKDVLDSAQPKSKFVLILGKSGMGKTSLLAKAIDQISKNDSVFVAKHACLDSEMLVPFASFRQVFKTTLMHFALHQNAEEDTRYEADECLVSTTMTALGKRLNAPPAVVEKATQYIVQSSESIVDQKGPAKTSIASFFAYAFVECCSTDKLTVLALCDIYRADEVTWKVLRRILTISTNVVLIGTSGLEKSAFRVGPNFWIDIECDFEPEDRYREIVLSPLFRHDIQKMVANRMKIKFEDVPPALLNEVVALSGGMPHFANKILKNILSQEGSIEVNIASFAENSLDEIILHRIDMLELNVRSVLNVCAIIGPEFTFGKVIAVLMEGSEAREADVRTDATRALEATIRDGIIACEDITNTDHVEVSEEMVFTNDSGMRFSQPMWRDALIGLMLASRRRDVHRKTAQSLTRVYGEQAPLEQLTELHSHWIQSGSTTESTATALKAGSMLEDIDKVSQSIHMYEDTLKLAGWRKETLSENFGFSDELLSVVPEEDILHMVQLCVALGKAKDLLLDHQYSIDMYESALHVMSNAPFSAQLRDRSIAFPAFVGLWNAIASGQLQQDSDFVYEQELTKTFMHETRTHGKLIHHVQALFMQMSLYLRSNAVDKALAVHSIIRKSYKPKKHSRGMRKRYQMDNGAVSGAIGSYLYMINGNRKQALGMCKHVLREIIPVIDGDFDQAFTIVYPLLFVFKEYGFAGQSKEIFHKVVLEPHGHSFGKSKMRMLQKVFLPINILLTLCGNVELSEEIMAEFCDWVADPSHMLLGSDVNLFLGRLGRCGDSINAEICYRVALRLDAAAPLRKRAITLGSLAATQASGFNRKHGLLLATRKSRELLFQLKELKNK